MTDHQSSSNRALALGGSRKDYPRSSSVFQPQISQPPSYEIVPQSETKVDKLVRGTVIIREKHPNHRGKCCVAYVGGKVEMVSE